MGYFVRGSYSSEPAHRALLWKTVKAKHIKSIHEYINLVKEIRKYVFIQRKTVVFMAECFQYPFTQWEILELLYSKQ